MHYEALKGLTDRARDPFHLSSPLRFESYALLALLRHLFGVHDVDHVPLNSALSLKKPRERIWHLDACTPRHGTSIQTFPESGTSKIL